MKQHDKSGAGARRRGDGFTLIEMIVVIAIIAVLAGLILAAMPAVKGKANRRAVATELEGLKTAINSYKAKKGVYPPDNPDTNKWDQAPLFYELTGTVQVTAQGTVEYQSLFSPGEPPLTAAQIQNAFGIGGFVNTSPERDEVDNFFKTLKPKQVEDIGGGIKVLVAPYKGKDNRMARWFYNSSKPVHNPGEYDLWAEIAMGGETIIIGNW